MKKGDQITIHNPRKLQKLLASQEAQAYAMAFLSFFSLAFFTVFAIRPTLTSFFNLQRQIEDAKLLNEQLDSKITSLLTAQKTFQDYQSEIALLDQALPPDPQFAQLIQKLETIVNEKESTISAFNTNAEVTLLDEEAVINPSIDTPAIEGEPVEPVVLPLESVSFSMTILADYIKNEAALTHLLSLKRMLSLSDLSISLISSTTQEEEVETTMNAEAHYFPKEEAR